MSRQLLISDLPDDVIFTILGYLSYDNVAQIRIVNSFFNQICKQHLNRGFKKVKEVHKKLVNNLNSMLPRRTSARRDHPYWQHWYILRLIGNFTLNGGLNTVSKTLGQYIDANLCCFIPGKIIDEIYNIFNILRNQEIPNRFEVLRELRDMSSLAKGHFAAEIMPRMKKRLQNHQNEESLERKQNKRIETLERTVAAQAKMLKEINKKLLESEQKIATLIKCSEREKDKRPVSAKNVQETSKKLKTS